MKKAGEVLSAIFDERLIKKARGYSRLFDFWTEAVKNNGIAAAADHSRIKELDRGILIIEADHPGWKQILQTKQGRLLNDFRRRFPEMDISGISLILGYGSTQIGEEAVDIEPVKETTFDVKNITGKSEILHEKKNNFDYNNIKDENFRKALQRLEQSIGVVERQSKAK